MGIGRKGKSASRASGARYRGEKERKGACGHSLNAAVLWYQILVSRSDWLDRRLLTALQRILTRWIVWMSHGVHVISINCEASSARSLERLKSNESFPQIVGLIKELKIFLHSVEKRARCFWNIHRIISTRVWPSSCFLGCFKKEMYGGTLNVRL